MTETSLRIGDNERSSVVAHLSDHYAAGRLTRDELESKSESALTARTQADLAPLLADLPRLPTVRAELRIEQPAMSPLAQKARTIWRNAVLAPWAVFAVVFVAIWLFTGVGYFWPVWPIMGWGIAVATSWFLARNAPEQFLERQRRCGRASNPAAR